MFLKCYYCDYVGKAEKCIQHSISLHPDNILKLRKKELNTHTGVVGQRTLNFNVIPSVLHQTNKSIHPYVKNEKISLKILNKNEVDVGFSNLSLQDTPSKSPVTKKIKTSTPCHDDLQNISFEVFFDEIPDISDESIPNKSENERYIDEIKACLPEVVQAMEQCGQIENWVTFHRLLSDAKFPLENIAFHLFMDVCKFYGSESVHSMRYSPIVKRFWRIGYCLFHGKFLNFMSGPKHTGEKLSKPNEMLKPENARINFAVPSKAIRKSAEIENAKPGILEDLIESLSIQENNDMKTYKLCVDGKKINSGKSAKGGDVNLFGHEQSPTFSERCEQLNNELSVITNVVDKITDLEIRQRLEMQNIPSEDKEYIVDKLKTVILHLSQRIKNLRTTLVSKSNLLDKLKTNAGSDWRKSKFVFVISAVETDMYDAKSTVSDLLKCIDELGFVISYANEKSFLYARDRSVDLDRQENYVNLNSKNDPSTSRYCKQGSSGWFEVRETAVVTGSTLFKAIGQGTLKEQQAHFDKIIYGRKEENPTTAVQERMQYGKDNEINAISTLVCKILPVYAPNAMYVEEGCYKFYTSDGKIPIVVSPDGSVRQSPDGNAIFAIECKCPFPGKQYTTPVYYSIPKYYVTQVVAEMIALNVDQLFFICYSNESSTVFLIKQSEELWKSIEREVMTIYSDNKPSRPTKKNVTSKRVTEEIKQFVENNVTFLCEIPSVQGIECSLESQGTFCYHQRSTKKTMPLLMDTSFVKKVLSQCESTMKRAYELSRTRATEFLGFMVSDLDRTYDAEMHHAIPVAYGLKGYSLPTSTLREMVEHVVQVCMQKGLYIPVCSFDGQWYRMAVRDRNEKPLTLLQLQRDVYLSAKSMSKTELVNFFYALNTVKCDQNIPRSLNITKIQSKLVVDNGFKVRRVVITPRIMKLMHGQEKSESYDYSEQNVDSNIADMIIRSIPESSSDKISDDLIENAVQVVSTSTITGDNNILVAMDDVGDMFLNMYNEKETEENVVDVDLEVEKAGKTVQSAQIHTENTVTNTFLMSLNTDANIDLMLNCLHEKRDLNPLSLRQKLSTSDSINKNFTKKQLVSLMSPLIPALKSNGVKCNVSQPKYVFTNLLSNIFGDGSWSCPVKRSKKNPALLTNLCRKAIQKIPKEVLNCVYAQHIFPLKLETFYQESPFGRTFRIDGFEDIQPDNWYSRPEYNEVFQNYFFVILDAYHQICGLRRLFCATGIPGRGVSNKPLISVAENSDSNNSGLNIAVARDLIDKQSIAYATQTFSENVESSLRDICAHMEADFCHIVRNWYQSEDEPGLSAHERCAQKLVFRQWLLNKVRFDEFPPDGSYVGGIPVVLYEGLLTGIERKIQLYPFTKKGTYNTRAIGSLDIENFFSTFQDIDPRGTGVLRPDDIPTALGIAAELLEARLDPNRGFHMQTSQKRVYPVNVFDTGDTLERMETSFNMVTDLSVIQLRDHDFDKPFRRRGKRARKSGKVSKHFEPAKNPLPVREHHRACEAKILPHVRRGLKLDI